MKYRRILAEFYRQPLALTREKVESIRDFLHAKAAGEDIDPKEVRELVAARHTLPDFYVDPESLAGSVVAAVPQRRPDGTQLIGQVAILPIIGVLSQRVGMLEESSGGISTERIGNSLDALVRDPTVKSILLHVDSPGGSVSGVPELGQKILAARDRKKVVGIANSTAASAGYWLLSQASEVYVTPGGWMGSIGVLYAHEDHSKELEMEGVKVTFITAGEHKVEGNFYEPLTDEARAEIQRITNYYYDMFLSTVAKGRGVTVAKVKADFGQGRMAVATEAVQRGMADRVATIEQVLKRLGAFEQASAGSSGLPVGAKLAAVKARVAKVQSEA